VSADTTTIRPALVVFSFEALRDLLHLPESATIISATSQGESHAVTFCIESPDFPESTFGAPMPEFSMNFVTRYAEDGKQHKFVGWVREP